MRLKSHQFSDFTDHMVEPLCRSEDQVAHPYICTRTKGHDDWHEAGLWWDRTEEAQAICATWW